MPQHTKDTIRASNCAKNRSKIDQKSIQNRLWNRFRFRDPFWSDFGPILGPTWGHLGGQVGAMLGKKSIFGGSRRHAKTTLISNTLRGPLGTDFGTILGRISPQLPPHLGAKMGAKTVQNREKIDAKMQSNFACILGSLFDRFRIDFGSETEEKMNPKSDLFWHVFSMSFLEVFGSVLAYFFIFVGLVKMSFWMQNTVFYH